MKGCAGLCRAVQGCAGLCRVARVRLQGVSHQMLIESPFVSVVKTPRMHASSVPFGSSSVANASQSGWSFAKVPRLSSAVSTTSSAESAIPRVRISQRGISTAPSGALNSRTPTWCPLSSGAPASRMRNSIGWGIFPPGRRAISCSSVEAGSMILSPSRRDSTSIASAETARRVSLHRPAKGRAVGVGIMGESGSTSKGSPTTSAYRRRRVRCAMLPSASPFAACAAAAARALARADAAKAPEGAASPRDIASAAASIASSSASASPSSSSSLSTTKGSCTRRGGGGGPRRSRRSGAVGAPLGAPRAGAPVREGAA